MGMQGKKMNVEFTTRGAQLFSVKLNDYKAYDSTDLYLIRPHGSQMGVSVFAGENINTKDFVFKVAEHSDSTIVMRLPFAGGGYIQQKYSLTEGSYMMKNELSFVGMGSVIPRNVSNVDMDWAIDMLTEGCYEDEDAKERHTKMTVKVRRIPRPPMS